MNQNGAATSYLMTLGRAFILYQVSPFNCYTECCDVFCCRTGYADADCHHAVKLSVINLRVCNAMCHYAMRRNGKCQCRYGEYHYSVVVLSILMMNVIVLSVTMPVAIPNVIMLSVAMPNVVAPSEHFVLLSKFNRIVFAALFRPWTLYIKQGTLIEGEGSVQLTSSLGKVVFVKKEKYSVSMKSNRPELVSARR